ncbi:MAG: class I SAM-dependent methyltransferase [Proteobacteria bacterium]|nr:class I SAM-dependent methyltransferase [Pseudomonadota bacterium]
MKLLARLHGALVFDRRTRVLSERLAQMLPPNAKVLDVGCGDGSIARLIGERRPDVTISGVDLIVRSRTHIPVAAFDGKRIPFEDGAFDIVMFVDVLHHTDDPETLLREARRVARQTVVLKDHTRDGLLAGPTLRFMDWVGNAPHGIPLPYNYWPERRWHEAFARLGLTPVIWLNKLALYPTPATWFFDRSLHFVARLDKV